jgi:hypothetical protein
MRRHDAPPFTTHSEGHARRSGSNWEFCRVALRLFASAAIGCDQTKAASTIPASVAGGGVFGRCGPRIGASSGGWPGSSSGRAGSPGSCTGGGTSGRGFPGGLSTGGSVGCPGLIGGCSGGSIGIFVTSPCGCLRDRARAGQRGCMFCSKPGAITAPANRCSAEPVQPGV